MGYATFNAVADKRECSVIYVHNNHARYFAQIAITITTTKL